MFDFEKLTVFNKSLELSGEIKSLISLLDKSEKVIKDQLRRSSTSVVLNIAEGTSRLSNPDKRNYYIVVRGSAMESIAILLILKNENLISDEMFQQFYFKSEEICRMLFAMIRILEKK